ncbi:hypothetical protein BLOT_008182 [Blomia tropicalis]|nr:hypothetical protein BLOT_008182 [Blomia tropicalis]
MIVAIRTFQTTTNLHKDTVLHQFLFLTLLFHLCTKLTLSHDRIISTVYILIIVQPCADVKPPSPLQQRQ